MNVLAAGGMFGHAKAIAGRQKPHAATKGRALVKEAREEVMEAELLVRQVCDYAKDGTRVSVPADARDRAVSRLRRAANDWAALGAGGKLEETWSLK